MKRVNEKTGSILIQLFAWEMLDRDSTVDPKALLRSLPIEDLHTVHGNILEDPRVLSLTTAQMVDLEIQYRTGLLEEDWSFERDSQRVLLHYTPIHHTMLRSHRRLEA
jgi:hypothetical protein